MPVITSRDHPLVKKLIKLGVSPSYRKKTGLTLLDGLHLSQVYFSVIGIPQNLIVSHSYFENTTNQCHLNILSNKNLLKIIIIRDALFRILSPVKTPTGILALISIPKLKKGVNRNEEIFSILLEEVQDPGNLGSILRSAAAANAGDVYLSKQCADPWSPKALRSAMGAHFFLRIHEACDLQEIAQKFNGVVIATSLQAPQSLFDISLTGPTAFIVGNEGAGLSREMILAADKNIYIPMPGKTESLNAAAAAAICFFEKVRQDKELAFHTTNGSK